MQSTNHPSNYLRRPLTTCLTSLAAIGAIILLSLQPLTSATAAAQDSQRRSRAANSKRTVITGTGEASLSQPRVHVQLSDAGGILEGEGVIIPGFDIVVEPDAQKSFSAFLDTGAGSFVISQETARRFKLKVDPKSTYIDVGLHGETAMEVTMPYELAIANSTGLLDDVPRNFVTIEKKARMQLNPARASRAQAMIGSIDVIGMPAIRRFLVEVDLAPLLIGSKKSGNPADDFDINDPDALDKLLDQVGESLPVGPAVKLHSPRKKKMPRVDLVVPLEYRNFNRTKNPANRGALPSLEENPMIVNVNSGRGSQNFKGDWLLDTGAAASIISSDHALALGLIDSSGNPKVEPVFSLPLSGISGQAETVPGYIIEKIEIKTANGGILEFRDVRAVVKDIHITMPDGRYITLDGVFGMNILFPSVSGMGSGWPSDMTQPPFKKIWIDGPRGRLGLEQN